MSIAVIIIPITIVLALFFIASFVWSVSRGQYDEFESHAISILDNHKKPELEETQCQQK